MKHCQQCGGEMEFIKTVNREVTGVRRRTTGGYSYTRKQTTAPKYYWLCRQSFGHTEPATEQEQPNG
jgi:hypothetical protein